MINMLKPAILSLSLLTIISTTAVAPALGEIEEYFFAVDRYIVQFVVVIHALAIIPALGAAPWLAGRFTKKRVVIAGLLLFVLSGVTGGMVNNIYLLLCMRAVLGIGLGLVIPFSTALIADFFEGEERQKLMGFSSSLNMVGGMSALIISGFLASISWRLPFLIYLCGIPVIFLILFFLPDKKDTVEKDEGKIKTPFPKHVYKVAFSMLLLSTLLFIYTPTMALFLKDNILGDSKVAGFAIAFATTGGIFAGLFLPRTLRLTGRFFVPSMLFVISIGFLLLNNAGVIALVFVATFITGFGNRSMYPVFFLKATQGIPRSYSVKATSILSATIYIGQFLAPNLQKFVGFVFNEPSIRFLYLFVAAVTFISGVLIMFQKILAMFRKSESTKTESLRSSK